MHTQLSEMYVNSIYFLLIRICVRVTNHSAQFFSVLFPVFGGSHKQTNIYIFFIMIIITYSFTIHLQFALIILGAVRIYYSQSAAIRNLCHCSKQPNNW